jgi:hypothetical protein
MLADSPRSGFNNILGAMRCDALMTSPTYGLAIRHHDNIQKLSVTHEHCFQLCDQVACFCCGESLAGTISLRSVDERLGRQ